jgi:Na+-driven multidrug efflux pump
MAWCAILLLRRRLALAIPLIWVLVAETAYDTVMNVMEGTREHLMGAASGVTWMILVFFVPMVVVSTVLLVVQLLARHTEPRNVNPAR